MKFWFTFGIWVTVAVAFAQSSVKFQIRNMGSTVEGSFDRFTLNIRWNASNPTASTVTGKVQVESINTGISLRDNHLRSSSYFHVKKYPEISFKSTRIEKSSTEALYFIIGQLSIKGITKEHAFTMRMLPDGRREFKTTLNRRDFGVGGWSLTMGDEVQVTVTE
uniref:YceI family protein n=1 Tax=Thermaurantimonas sp. TaxID=2681568 RepID=UPI00391AE48F